MAVSSSRTAFKRTPFVARDGELQELERLLHEAADGNGALVMVGGEPGIGKSRLSDELASIARRDGFLTIAGHCYEGNATAPYLPLVDAIEAAIAALPAEVGQRTLAGSDAVRSLIPQLVSAGANLPERELAPEHERHYLFNAVRDFFAALCRERPVLLVLEDLHWAGAPTILLIRHLAQSIQNERLLVVGTFRNNPASDAASLSGLLSDARRSASGHLMELSPLAEPAVGQIVNLISGGESPASVVRILYEQTEGNPFFVEEMAKHLIEEGRLIDATGRWLRDPATYELNVPDTVRGVIGRRLDNISPDLRRTLTAAAIIGRTFDFELLAALTEQDGEALLDSLDEAVRARLLTSESGRDGRLSFAHELVRQTLLSEISAPRRQRLHLRTLRAIESMYGANAEDRVAQLAYHAMHAGGAIDNEATIQYTTRAAERALAATDYAESARLYRYVLPLVPHDDTKQRCELILRLGVAEKRISDSDEARMLFMEAAALARKLGDPERLARAALGFARSWATIGSVDEPAVDLLREAVAAIGDEPTALRGQLLSRLAGQLLYSSSMNEVMALSKKAVETARRSGDPVALARALQTRHVVLWGPEHLEERMSCANEILDVSRSLGLEEIALWSHRPRIADLTALGRMSDADAELETYAALAESYRQTLYTWQAAVRRAMLAAFRGRLVEAERLTMEAFQQGQRAGGQNLTAAFGEQMLVVRWLQGRIAELEPLAVASHKAQPTVAVWRSVLAFIYAESGREAEAREHLDYLSADGFSRLSKDDTRLISEVLLSVVAARLGDSDAAAYLYEELLPWGNRNMILSEGVVCVGSSEYYLAISAATARRWDAAEAHFQAALAFNESTGGRPWQPFAQTDYALILLARRGPGDRKRAADLLQEALATAKELGMAGHVARVERMLSSHKGLSPDLPDRLTRREAEILRLVAMGLSNREISESLVLSERTTARHVTNIYGKIGARNRADATLYAIRTGLVER